MRFFTSSFLFQDNSSGSGSIKISIPKKNIQIEILFQDYQFFWYFFKFDIVGAKVVEFNVQRSTFYFSF